VLPWHHVFGLVMALMAAIVGGAGVVHRGIATSTDHIVELAASIGATHLSMVPLTASRLAAAPGGRALLSSLAGGVIGGAPIGAPLARALSATRLRVGYGQTEAGPGISLGELGGFEAGTLGRPVGCDVRIVDGELWFRGPNACIGVFRDGQHIALEPDRWVATGDLVDCDGQGRLRFLGRRAECWKLPNGRMVVPGPLETAIARAIGGDAEALVWASPDGAAIDVVVGVDVDERAVRDALGSLAARMGTLHVLPSDAWARTNKGSVDRARTLIVARSHTSPETSP
jgi:acyl-CoA synthetase (AMP-forming)/AMP-acid ligase II